MQQKSFATTMAAAGSVVLRDVATTDRQKMMEYLLTADGPCVLTVRDEAGTTYGVYVLNSAPPPVAARAVPGEPRFVAVGDVYLDISTSRVVAGHVIIAPN